MAYASGNPKSGKQLKEWVASGKTVRAFQPGGIFPLSKTDGEITIEGPHFPKPHRFWVRVEIKNSVIVKVLNRR